MELPRRPRRLAVAQTSIRQAGRLAKKKVYLVPEINAHTEQRRNGGWRSWIVLGSPLAQTACSV
jgi:hypothetical protein